MIEVARIAAIMKAHHLNTSELAEIVRLSPSKISKVLSGDQKFTSDAVGILINELGIHPNWLFGYEGGPEKIVYLKDFVHKSELEKLESRIRELKDELGEVYKQLAEERRPK
ncbi:helix-turn-helix transcriptional regulator [Dyadobacter sp. 676]|uniref:Helix-turn-helix transcriptional regulator n=1 Tax=Dyadobacter sp. 676 TaxID=3088362 RepID=A0AAU8FNB9_9BACT